MIRFLAHMTDHGSGVSLYRGWGPLSHLRRYGIEFYPFKEVNWPVLAQYDGVYMVRPTTETDIGIMKHAQSCGRKVWIDYDDDIFDVPPGNPAWGYYQRPQVRKNAEYLIRRADRVSVSTAYLASQLKKYREHDDIWLLPNAFPEHLKPWNIKLPERKKIISWRGSRTHDQDLHLAIPFYREAIERLPDWKFSFFGDIDYITQEIFPKDRIQVYQFSDVSEYFDRFAMEGSSIHIVPLAVNGFNRAKSNIAWIEATWAGAATFGPSLNMEEWDHPGILPLDSFWNYINMEVDMSEMVSASRKYIEENLLLKHVNPFRVKLIEGML